MRPAQSCARSVLLHSAGHCPKTVPPLARAQVATECSRHGWAVSRCHRGVRGHGTLLEPACNPCCTAGTQACQAAAHGFSPGQTPSWHCGLCSGCNLGSSFFFYLDFFIPEALLPLLTAFITARGGYILVLLNELFNFYSRKVTNAKNQSHKAKF